MTKKQRDCRKCRNYTEDPADSFYSGIHDFWNACLEHKIENFDPTDPFNSGELCPDHPEADPFKKQDTIYFREV